MALIGWNDFVVWQCSLRQRNFRIYNGKPSEGTLALILDKESNKEIVRLRSILLEKKPLNSSKMFEFMIKKTNDPEERFLKAVKFFSSEYYNSAKNFDGSFSATFLYQSELAKKILKKKKCDVQFFEYDTGFHFTTTVTKLKRSNSKWMYTFFHNFLFNPELNENIDILYFKPDKAGFKKIS